MALWDLTHSIATLGDRSLSGRIHLGAPASGLSELTIAGQSLAATSLLGVMIDASSSDSVETYVRAGDLVATYPETAARPMRVQVYWRIPAAWQPDERVHVVDLQVSVQTSALGVPVPLSTRSTVAADEGLRLTSANSDRFEPMRTAEPCRLRPSQGPGCVLLRGVGQHWSYVEMIHPADFSDDELTVFSGQRGGSAIFQLTHHLFPEALEKGVILRGQVRGGWVPRDDDQRIAAALYSDFVSLPPPLTT